MTLHATTWYELVCDGCGRHEDLGAGLDESAVLPKPPGWVMSVYRDDRPHDYCPRCAANLAPQLAPSSPPPAASWRLPAEDACSPVAAGTGALPPVPVPPAGDERIDPSE